MLLFPTYGKDGVIVIDDDDNDQDVDLIGEEAEERPASLIASTKKKICKFRFEHSSCIYTQYINGFVSLDSLGVDCNSCHSAGL